MFKRIFAAIAGFAGAVCWLIGFNPRSEGHFVVSDLQNARTWTAPGPPYRFVTILYRDGSSKTFAIDDEDLAYLQAYRLP